MPDTKQNIWPGPGNIEEESACDLNAMRAIGKLLARTARKEARTAAANEVIDLAPLLKLWQEGTHAVGDVVTYAGAPYKCAQAHDSTGNPDWTPDKVPALWAPCHATDRAHALPWQAPTGAQDAYQTGEWMLWTDGFAYRCTRDATVWGPDTLPGAWEVAT